MVCQYVRKRNQRMLTSACPRTDCTAANSSRTTLKEKCASLRMSLGHSFMHKAAYTCRGTGGTYLLSSLICRKAEGCRAHCRRACRRICSNDAIMSMSSGNTACSCPQPYRKRSSRQGGFVVCEEREHQRRQTASPYPKSRYANTTQTILSKARACEYNGIPVARAVSPPVCAPPFVRAEERMDV